LAKAGGDGPEPEKIRLIPVEGLFIGGGYCAKSTTERLVSTVKSAVSTL